MANNELYGKFWELYDKSVEDQKYIRYLEETLDALGVVVHRDVKGEIYLGGRGVNRQLDDE